MASDLNTFAHKGCKIATQKKVCFSANFASKLQGVSFNLDLKVLENNDPDEDFEAVAKLKEQVHKLRMEDRDDDEELEITLGDFFLTLC